MSPKQYSFDALCMTKALHLAKRGWKFAHPNPMVGCLLVKNKKIVGAGYHHKFGGDHAEVAALKKAGEKAKGATAYVTLEPCSHQGQTPPCAPALLAAGISRVVIATPDPNPKVRGRGIALLKKNGVQVAIGVMDNAAKELNKPFFKRMTKKMPWVTIKLATTLDGKIATQSGDSKWISSPVSRDFVHKLRSHVDAVLVGANTVLVDNPSLTSHGHGANPLRVVIDPSLRLPATRRVFVNRPEKTVVLTVAGVNRNRKKYIEERGLRVIELAAKNGRIKTEAILRALAGLGVAHLLVEGGGETVARFIQERNADELYYVINPTMIAGGDAVSAVGDLGISSIGKALRLKNLAVNKSGSDFIIHGSF